MQIHLTQSMIEANNIKRKEAVERRGRKRQWKGEEERGSGKERKKEAEERKEVHNQYLLQSIAAISQCIHLSLAHWGPRCHLTGI